MLYNVIPPAINHGLKQIVLSLVTGPLTLVVSFNCALEDFSKQLVVTEFDLPFSFEHFLEGPLSLEFPDPFIC
jgi:hypothetical protein